MSKNLYRQRTPIITAEQFKWGIGPASALGVEAYQKQVPVFDEFDSNTQVAYRAKTAFGTYFEVNHDDWILWNQDGIFAVIKDADFKRTYVKVDTDG